MEFEWNDWNLEHLARHGVEPAEAEAVICGARSPYPIRRENDKWLVWGPGQGGRLMQVVYVVDELDGLFVIHARPLTHREKRRWQRGKRKRP